jgi:NADPH:quinone reductase-like Zn-dependent oxidoreductase
VCLNPCLRTGGRQAWETEKSKRTIVESFFDFFYAEVTTARLQTLRTLFDAGRITARVGSILPLSEARQAQRMLAGAPHKSGKIVLQIGHPR